MPYRGEHASKTPNRGRPPHTTYEGQAHGGIGVCMWRDRTLACVCVLSADCCQCVARPHPTDRSDQASVCHVSRGVSRD
eukprot:3217969-Prymnesium_polylepis.1